MPTLIAILLGLILLAFTWTSVLFTLVLPRAQWGPGRLSVSVNRATRWLLNLVSKLTQSYERKDAVLALVGPIAVLAQLVLWLLLFGAAFVIMLLPYTHNLGHAIEEVGAAMFTLGLARSSTNTNDAIVIIAAASGFVVIALQIAYLPSLYAAFNRRESLISMLAGPRGRAVVGPGDPDPASTRRDRRRAARLLRVVGAVGGRVLRVALVVPGAPALPVTRSVVVVGPGAALGARRRRDATRVEPEHHSLAGAPVPANGLHGVAPGLEGARVGLRRRPAPRRPAAALARGVRDGRRPAARQRIPHGARHRRGLAPLPAVGASTTRISPIAGPIGSSHRPRRGRAPARACTNKT